MKTAVRASAAVQRARGLVSLVGTTLAKRELLLDRIVVNANAGAVIRGADEFDAGCFEGVLKSVNCARACRGDAVFGFNAFDCAERHARFFTEPLD